MWIYCCRNHDPGRNLYTTYCSFGPQSGYLFGRKIDLFFSKKISGRKMVTAGYVVSLSWCLFFSVAKKIKQRKNCETEEKIIKMKNTERKVNDRHQHVGYSLIRGVRFKINRVSVVHDLNQFTYFSFHVRFFVSQYSSIIEFEIVRVLKSVLAQGS